MKFIYIILTLIISNTAGAHLNLGAYTGKTANNQTCSFIVEKSYFENNMQHPLNERIILNVGNLKFTVQHPPVVDVQNAIAAYNHDLFQGLIATSVGAQAIVITMKHTTREEGPTEFHLINHEYKTNKKEKVSCYNLQAPKGFRR